MGYFQFYDGPLSGEPVMTVADLMRPDVITATLGTSVTEVATKLRERNVGNVLVVADSRPIGIVTDREGAIRTAADILDPNRKTGGEVMTEDPATADINTGVMELCNEICEEGVRRMPIVDGDELVGIITLDDLARFLLSELDSLAGVLEVESPSY